MEILAGRILLRPADPERSRVFYREVLGLAICREYGDPANPGLVFFLGGGYLEVAPQGSGRAGGSGSRSTNLWLQVRDIEAEAQRLTTAGVRIVRPPQQEPWGLIEMWIADPDGMPIVLVEVPPDHPIRRDQRN